MSMPTDGKVYFAGCYAPDGYDMRVVKIGCAGDPEKRVKSVKVGQPFECRLLTWMPGDIFMEYFVHFWLRADHLTGEFFRWRGETARVIEHVRQFGTHPFPIRWTGPEGTFSSLDLVAFMERNGISLDDVRKESRVACKGYETMLAKERCGNRRFLAALSVTAIRRGIPLNWPRDFQAASRAPLQAAA